MEYLEWILNELKSATNGNIKKLTSFLGIYAALLVFGLIGMGRTEIGGHTVPVLVFFVYGIRQLWKDRLGLNIKYVFVSFEVFLFIISCALLFGGLYYGIVGGYTRSEKVTAKLVKRAFFEGGLSLSIFIIISSIRYIVSKIFKKDINS